ncbi:hypothetical protein PVAND_014898 [Polypedilum vanderplanki]|uniref:FLYWCH-type domain-containing protein n=1 Tax=Polypedilum vanderplanki TaxID=319348 RepID=A0A9J6BBH8_POLVA|nr:hypothetical protein PVAND_014898 [Polypedilum vanderplanki]
MEYEKIFIGRGKGRIFIKSEKCLYRIYRKREELKYLRCIEKSCPCRAKLTATAKLERTNKCNHTHNNHEARMKWEKPYGELKKQISNQNRPIRDIYNENIRKLNINTSLRTPQTATSDFESGMRNSLKSVWPEIQLVGCNFHYCQALRRKAMCLQTLSTKITKKDHKHGYILKLFMRLSYLPENYIDIGFEALINYINLNKILARDFETFIQYFKHTWMRRIPKSDWSVATRERRTNNHLEGYNRFVKRQIPCNPGPWTFLNSLLNLGCYACMNFFEDQETNCSQKDRSKITDLLHKTLIELHNGEITELLFLKKLAKHLD